GLEVPGPVRRLAADHGARVDPQHVAGAVETERDVDRRGVDPQGDGEAGQRPRVRPLEHRAQRVGVGVRARRARAYPGDELVARAHAVAKAATTCSRSPGWVARCASSAWRAAANEPAPIVVGERSSALATMNRSTPR